MKKYNCQIWQGSILMILWFLVISKLSIISFEPQNFTEALRLRFPLVKRWPNWCQLPIDNGLLRSVLSFFRCFIRFRVIIICWFQNGPFIILFIHQESKFTEKFISTILSSSSILNTFSKYKCVIWPFDVTRSIDKQKYSYFHRTFNSSCKPFDFCLLFTTQTSRKQCKATISFHQLLLVHHQSEWLSSLIDFSAWKTTSTFAKYRVRLLGCRSNAFMSWKNTQSSHRKTATTIERCLFIKSICKMRKHFSCNYFFVRMFQYPSFGLVVSPQVTISINHDLSLVRKKK